jgi:putative addiction module killer protein
MKYLDKQDRALFSIWFNQLDPHAAAKVAAAKVAVARYRLELGNFSNVKSLGNGVYEYKMDFGPGYRIYFGQVGKELIILLGGSTKKRQQSDIKIAKERWEEYKKRKKEMKNS